MAHLWLLPLAGSSPLLNVAQRVQEELQVVYLVVSWVYLPTQSFLQKNHCYWKSLSSSLTSYCFQSCLVQPLQVDQRLPRDLLLLVLQPLETLSQLAPPVVLAGDLLPRVLSFFAVSLSGLALSHERSQPLVCPQKHLQQSLSAVCLCQLVLLLLLELLSWACAPQPRRRTTKVRV